MIDRHTHEQAESHRKDTKETILADLLALADRAERAGGGNVALFLRCVAVADDRNVGDKLFEAVAGVMIRSIMEEVQERLDEEGGHDPEALLQEVADGVFGKGHVRVAAMNVTDVLGRDPNEVGH